MDIEYTVKVKGKNVPKFAKGLGKGVLSKVVISYKGMTKEKITPMFYVHMDDQKKKLLDDCIEVSYKIVPAKKKKK